jgi:hypothetical protein
MMEKLIKVGKNEENRKDVNMKYLSAIITIMIFLIGGFIGYGKLQAEQKNTKEAVKEVKEEVKETDEKIIENDKVDIEQTATLKYIQQSLEKLNEKIDKENAK